MTEKEYPLAKGFERIGKAYQELFTMGSRSYGWSGNVTYEEAMQRVGRLEEEGRDVLVCKPTFEADGSIAVERVGKSQVQKVAIFTCLDPDAAREMNANLARNTPEVTVVYSGRRVA
jgi:hypothetical protein